MKNQIELVIKPKESDIGIPVKRALPTAKRRMVGPFIFLDEMGPITLRPPRDHMDVKPHPHIGLSTLTYLFEGALIHRDSLGVVQPIVPGEVNWMTAGKGISHSEREPKNVRGGDRRLHGLQFWVALPKELEDMEPSFEHYEDADIPVVEEDSFCAKVVAGSAFGKTSKLKAFSPMSLVVIDANGAGSYAHSGEDHEHAIYIVKGELEIEGQRYSERQLIVFKKGSEIEVKHSDGTLYALVGGEPFPEKRHIWWNFVSCDKDKIAKARQAWIDGSFPQVPNDDEIIPVPGEYPIVVNYP